jgi:hypothetical protein
VIAEFSSESTAFVIRAQVPGFSGTLVTKYKTSPYRNPDGHILVSTAKSHHTNIILDFEGVLSTFTIYGVLETDLDPILRKLVTLCCEIKVSGIVQPRTGHEGPERE